MLMTEDALYGIALDIAYLPSFLVGRRRERMSAIRGENPTVIVGFFVIALQREKVYIL
jgi:hypothetical protein